MFWLWLLSVATRFENALTSSAPYPDLNFFENRERRSSLATFKFGILFGRYFVGTRADHKQPGLALTANTEVGCDRQGRLCG